MSKINGAIAVTRFGMGATPGEINVAATDPRGWLLAQLETPHKALITESDLPSTTQAMKAFIEIAHEQRMMRKALGRATPQKTPGNANSQKAPGNAGPQRTDPAKRGAKNQANAPMQAQRHKNRQQLQSEIRTRSMHATNTRHSFLERWVRFWGNHFSVSARGPNMVPLVGPFEREVIRPHAFSSFHTLLEKAVLHQAMLVYLNNDRSFGPSTKLAKRRKIGLNENLAREILELHTLGVHGGYSQEDVTAFAKALTGWTISTPALQSTGFGEVIFEPRIHEPGPQTIIGKSYPQEDGTQAKAILRDLALAPQTAQHIADGVIRHFISDTPLPDASRVVKDVFLKTGGDLAELAKAVVTLDTAWDPAQRKLKTPEELLISAARGIGFSPVFGRNARFIHISLGQQPFTAPSPDGWPDTAIDWAGSDAIKKRLEWANRAAHRAPARINAADFLDQAMGDLATEPTRLAISRAESRKQALTLALMSPEFQRR